MFSKKKQRKKTDPQLDNLLEPFQEVIDEAIDLNWADLDDGEFTLNNVNYDKSTASQAVAFVIRASRRGVVPLCAEVADLLKEKNRLESVIEEQSQEILHLMDNQAVPRSPIPPPPEMFDFSSQTVQEMSAQTVELVDRAIQSETIVLGCTRRKCLSEDGVKEPRTQSNLPGVKFACGKEFVVNCLCPSFSTTSTQNPSKSSVGVNTISSKERLESTLGYEGHRNLESKHKELVNDLKVVKENTKEINVQNKTLAVDLESAKKEIVSLQKVIQEMQNKEYERIQEEREKINETFSIQAEHDVDDVSSFEDDANNAESRKMRRAFLPIVASSRQQETWQRVKSFPGPIFGCKCSMCESFFKSSGLLGFASSPYITDGSGRNPVLKDIKKLLHLQSSKLRVRQNDHVIIKGNCLGTVKYVGHLDGLGSSSAVYMGIELETANGKHDGNFGSKRYFYCQHNHGLFVPLQDLIYIVNRKLSLPQSGSQSRRIRTDLPQVTDKKPVRKSNRRYSSSASETTSNASSSIRFLKTR